MSTQPVNSDDKPNLDLMDPAVQHCPYDAYAWMRENEPVYLDPVTGQYFVTTYECLRQAMRDTKTYSAEVNWQSLREGGVLDAGRDAFAERGWPPQPGLVQTDEPLHKEKRDLVDKVFTAGRVNKMTPYVNQCANDLIDAFIDDGECEMMTQFAVPLPCTIIAEQIGVPREDIWMFKEWSDANMKRNSNMNSDEEEMVCIETLLEGQHYFKRVIDSRRAAPKDDIISELISTEMSSGRQLNEAELIAMLMGDVLTGGNETTTSSITAGMKLLIDNPDQLALLRENPKLIRNFVEEVIRLETPVQGLYRMATMDTELGGVAIPKGAIMNMRYAAANRDESVFAGAARLDVTRKNAGSHFAFGSGVHHCMGASLARREMLSAFTIILDRMENFAYKPGFEEQEFLPSILQRTMKELHFTFDKKG